MLGREPSDLERCNWNRNIDSRSGLGLVATFVFIQVRVFRWYDHRQRLSFTNTLVLKVCCSNSKGSVNSSRGISGCVSVMPALKFPYILNQRNNVLLKIIADLL